MQAMRSVLYVIAAVTVLGVRTLSAQASARAGTQSGAQSGTQSGTQATASAGTTLPTLPSLHDTMFVRIGNDVIGRGITTWQRFGLEQLQVYTWISAADGEIITDSLFTDPSTLRPIRESRVTRDTTYLVHFTRDTLFISRLFDDKSTTSHAVAPSPDLYSSASIGMLAATMPLQRGASRSSLVFYGPPSRRDTQWVVLLVRSREMLNGRAAWRVVANRRADSTAYWVDEATRRILQMDEFEGTAKVTFRPPPAP